MFDTKFDDITVTTRLLRSWKAVRPEESATVDPTAHALLVGVAIENEPIKIVISIKDLTYP